MKQTTVTFSDMEKAEIERVAQARGVSFEEAVNQLVSEGLLSRVSKINRRVPSTVLPFKKWRGGRDGGRV